MRNELAVADIVSASPETGVITGLSAIDTGARAIGYAATCRCPPRDNLALHRALATAPPGSILVCDAAGRIDGGYFGELMATDAASAGIVGLVIDGSIRDAAGLRELAFPVFAAGHHPRPCLKVAAGEVGTGVTIRGTQIEDGDLVVADDDGIVIVSSNDIEATLALAEKLASREASIAQSLSTQRLWQILGLSIRSPRLGFDLEEGQPRP